ncbi:PRC-barrel domain-containing protein [Planctomicrobium piriforme]|uniref:PRC-barrel domain-containing protein n=1 Tax=Planctomicrobium piriforme TaxID=1576369 RepID=A0A1I3D8A7_9PLAN|nr:PRC-barrel domain-containing protein [Planctomicrobium piriforme]SFH82942.1 PRC-barrel domain-containing protein [Planctomicrobium piriforme]
MKRVWGVIVSSALLAGGAASAQDVQVQLKDGRNAPIQGQGTVPGNQVQSNQNSQQADPNRQGSQIQVDARRVDPGATDSVVRASTLIGSQLLDSNGQSLGKISDLVLDLNSQSIQYVVLDAQQADSYIAVPPTVLNTRYENNNAQVITTVPADQFRQAPTFTRSQWSARGFDPQWTQRNNTFYQQYSRTPNAVDRQLNRQENRLERKIDRVN